MLKFNRKPVLAIVGSAFVATLGSANVALANPFVAVELDSGYALAAKDAEGKCGEGKCGTDSAEKDTEGKCGEGKCGTDTDTEGKDTEGKCGEGKCGSA